MTTAPRRARLLAEGAGTGLLVLTVVGSGIAAERLSPGDTGLQLLENTLATVLGLAALILAFGSVSGAHFNPAVSLVERARGRLDASDTAAYIAAQVAGGCAGAVVANLLFELPAIELSSSTRSSGGQWLGEVVATFGLVVVIAGVVRSGRAAAVPAAVAGWIGAAYWATSSTSFANPAVTVARTLSDTFAGIRPSSAPAFVAAELVGAGLALVFVHTVFPDIEEAVDARPADAQP
ncbi:MAG: aquaporin [Acidimicrobiales bacterium]